MGCSQYTRLAHVETGRVVVVVTVCALQEASSRDHATTSHASFCMIQKSNAMPTIYIYVNDQKDLIFLSKKKMIEPKTQFQEEYGIIAVLAVSVGLVVGSFVFIVVKALCNRRQN